MSRTDFEQCTPVEFYETWRAWNEKRKTAEHGHWERARIMALFFAQPYSKQRLTPHDLLPLPWDKEDAEPATEAEVSEEERERRFEAARRRFGLK